MEKPLVLFTNDDGVHSPGLLALVEQFVNHYEVLVVAPQDQQSSVGCAMPPHSSGKIHTHNVQIAGNDVKFYGVDASPVQAVQYGVLELATRTPDLVVSGINYGENLGASVIVSGTVGAAIEASLLGIPSIAVSLQVVEDLQLTYDRSVDFSVAAYHALQFASLIVKKGLPHSVDLLKIDIPDRASHDTPWKTTRVSKHKRYLLKTNPRANLEDESKFIKVANPVTFEEDSDIRAVYDDNLISVTPLIANWTATNGNSLERHFANNTEEVTDG